MCSVWWNMAQYPIRLSVAERKASLLCWCALVCIAVINQSERESEVQVFIVRAKRIFVKTFHSINKKRELGNRNMMITKRFSYRKNVFLGKRRVVARSCGGCEGNRLRVINVFLFDCEKMWNDVHWWLHWLASAKSIQILWNDESISNDLLCMMGGVPCLFKQKNRLNFIDRFF